MKAVVLHKPNTGRFNRTNQPKSRNNVVERRLQHALNYLEIYFEQHVKVEGKLHAYNVDIYIPRYKICIFIDGNHWHRDLDKRIIARGKSKAQKRREDQDAVDDLEDNHCKVIRLTDLDVNSNLRKCVFIIIGRHPERLRQIYRKKIRMEKSVSIHMAHVELKLIKDLILADEEERRKESLPYRRLFHTIQALQPKKKRDWLNSKEHRVNYYDKE